MLKYIPIVGLFALAGCAGDAGIGTDQCATARSGLSAAEALAVGVNFTPEHQAWANASVAAAEALVASLCPMP